MSGWTSGYVADVEYTIGYFNELNPVRLPIGFLNVGYTPPKIVNACELGFGQGMSIAMHAAAQPHVNWYGDDFNPDHVLFARWLNDAAGASAELTDESFEQFCSRDDLPMFDFIGLHGVWTWVSPQNREIIVDFIHRKLNVGGVVYCSYNVMPGWATAAPIRELMAMHAGMTAGRGVGSGQKMEAALAFITDMFNQEPQFLTANPLATDKLAEMKSKTADYLSHEYLNSSWDPMYFNEIAEIFGEAKLTFACSAVYPDAIDELHFTPAQRVWLDGIDNEGFRETLRDFFRNAQFRKDYWVKGAVAAPAVERIEAIRDIRVVLTNIPSSLPQNIRSSLGVVALIPEIYGPIMDFLSDFKPHSIREIEAAIGPAAGFAQVFQAVMLLSATSHLGFAQTDEQIAAAAPRTRRLNLALLRRALAEDRIGYLASPVTGGAVGVTRIDQLFLKFWAEGLNEPEDWAEGVWRLMEAAGQRAHKDGAPVATAEESRSILVQAAAIFGSTSLPLLEGLKIAQRGKVSPAGRKDGR